ncbi:hypothetical protein GIB67_019830, partial [Kingdonia uniflora]
MVVYDESDIICHNMLRMNKTCFISFCDRLRGKGLRVSKHLDVEEQVAIFLLIVGHDTRFKHAQALTMRSLETISKYFHVVLKYVLRLSKDLIKHATPDLSLATRNNHHAWANTYFKDCAGAVDGTFIPAIVPLEDQPRYHTRKEDIKQNVFVACCLLLVACSFDMKITEIFARWEGSTHNSRILRAAVNYDMYPFTVPRGEACLGGVALEEEEAPPVVEVEEAEDVEDLGGMAMRDVHGWIFCLILACVGMVYCKG